MTIHVLGLNHKTAPIEIRERASFSGARLDKALRDLRDLGVDESVILSTCNRTEFYTACAKEAGASRLRSFIAAAMGMPESQLEGYCYSYDDRRAVEHLFRVVSSLDSMIVGETQVLGQVKDAYFTARKCNAVGRVLDPLFVEAIRVGKKVRTDTQIGKGAVSTSTAAIELARKIFETLQDKVVLIIGAGKIGELTVKNLHARGISTVIVANRTLAKAQELAGLFAGKAIAFDCVGDYLRQADIVLCSTSAPHYVITGDDVRAVMLRRQDTPLFLIDLGMPRNIEPAAGSLENVYLYNIDDLARVCDANMQERLQEAEKARAIVARCAQALVARLQAESERVLTP